MSPVPAGFLARRAFDPASLSPSEWWKGDGTYWQDSARTTPAVADGDVIGAWDDASGNGRHAVQSTSALRAVLKTGANGLNGHPVVRCGSGQRLLGTIAASAVQRVFIVAKKRSVPTTTTEALCGYATSTTGYLTAGTLVGLGYNWLQTEALGVQNLGGTPTNWNIIALRLASASSLAVRFNGGAVAIAPFDPRDVIITATALTLGAANNVSGTNPGDYDIAEVFRTSAALSVANEDNVGNYLATKYGLAWTPLT